MMRIGVVWNMYVGAATLCAALLGTALVFLPPPVVKFERMVITPYVEQGGLAVFRNTWSFDRPCAFTIYRTVYDVRRQIIHSSSEHRPAEFQPAGKTVSRLLVIPIAPVANPGTAEYESKTVWECNWLQTLFQPLYANAPIQFEIILKQRSRSP